jgi:hypothetical protein
MGRSDRHTKIHINKDTWQSRFQILVYFITSQQDVATKSSTSQITRTDATAQLLRSQNVDDNQDRADGDERPSPKTLSAYSVHRIIDRRRSIARPSLTARSVCLRQERDELVRVSSDARGSRQSRRLIFVTTSTLLHGAPCQYVNPVALS